MAWQDLHEGILTEFVDSSAMVQLTMDFEERAVLGVSELSWVQFAKNTWASRGRAWIALRNAKRRKKNHPRRPAWNRGLMLVNAAETRAKANARRRERYAANIEVERAKTRARMRRWSEGWRSFLSRTPEAA